MHSVLHSAEQTADIVLIQEPQWGPHGTVRHPSFECIIPGGGAPQSRPRVALYISNVAKEVAGLQVQTREDLVKDPDAQAFEVATPLIPSTLIYNIYNQKDREGKHTIDRLFTPETPLGERTIMAGDFNAHHPWWNSRIRRPKHADTLVPLLERNGFDLLNEEDAPTHFPTNNNNPSVLDLTFASPSLFDSVQKWSIDSLAGSGSDHAVIRFELQALDATTVPDPTNSNRFAWKRADWALFRSTLKGIADRHSEKWKLALSHSHHHHNLDVAAVLLRDAILSAIATSVPKSKPCTRSKAWWTPELSEKHLEMNRSERRWKQTGTLDALLDFKMQRKWFAMAVNEAKASHWDRFLEEVKGKDVYKAFRYTKPPRVQRTSVIQANGQVATVFKDKACLFRQTLFPPPPDYQPPETPPNVNRIPWKPITDREVEQAILTSAPNKAPGPDGITFACLRQAYQAIPAWFNSLFREVLNQGYHPRCWREATGAIVPKPNKPDYTQVKAYRIVALLNCLGKIAEKLVAQRLADLCEDFGLLHKDQMGGRRHRSAQDAIMALVHDVELGWKQGLTSSALFLDVKGAFDNVSKVRLIEIMNQMGLPNQLVQWVEHFMSHRVIALAFDGNKEELQPVETGIPQGSPCSPILFIIYLKPLFDALEKHDLPLQFPSYMDDVAIIATGKSAVANVKLLERAAAITFEWAAANAVAFDDSKSELIHFTRSRRPLQTLQLPNGTVVQPAPVLRWLGVFLDSKLNFKAHVATKVAAAQRALAGLLRLSNTEKGLSIGHMRQLYQACVVPVADFGSEIWWRSKGQDSLCRKLQLLQNTATRRILGAFRTTPTTLLDLEAALPPAQIRLTYAQRRYALRLLRLPPSHPVVRRCPEYFHPSGTGFPEDQIPGQQWYDPETRRKRHSTCLIRVLWSLSPWLDPTHPVEEVAAADSSLPALVPIDFHIAPVSKAAAAQQHLQLYKSIDRRRSMVAYTDGSKVGETVGAGYVLYAPSRIPYYGSFPLGTTNEVFDAELYACLQACRKAATLIHECQEVKDIWIFLDNSAAVRRLQHLQPGSGQMYAAELHDCADELASYRVKLHIHWVPGHTRIAGNEVADQLAKAGCSRPFSPREVPFSYAYLRRKVKAQVQKDWLQLWEKRDTAKHYLGTPSTRLHPMVATIAKRHSSRLVQIRSRHGHFNSYLARIRSSSVPSPSCPCGSREQTPEHLVLWCLRFKKEQRQFLSQFIIKDAHGQRWMDVYSRKGTQALLSFLEATSLCLRPQVAADWIYGLGELSQSENGDGNA